MNDPVAELSDTYIGWTQQALERFQTLLASHSEPQTDVDKLRQDLHRIAHDIKGMGGSFGFPLMTDFGTSLCLYLRNLPDGTTLKIDVITAHLDVMNRVLTDGIKGPGNEQDRATVSTLAEQVNEIVGELTSD